MLKVLGLVEESSFVKIYSPMLSISLYSLFAIAVSAQDLSEDSSANEGMAEGLLLSTIFILIMIMIIRKSSDFGKFGKLKNMAFISKSIFWFWTWMTFSVPFSFLFDGSSSGDIFMAFFCATPVFILPVYFVINFITSPIEMKITSTLFGTKALELRDGLEETINQNITLSNEKKLIEEKLTLGNLTHNENIRLRQELNDMEGSLERNKDKMDSMASELENLRLQIKNKEQVEEKKFEGLGSLFGSEQKPQPSKTNMNYQDSVHQGDHVGQKVDSQTINDPDAIARIALESYKQAMKDMREKEW